MKPEDDGRAPRCTRRSGRIWLAVLAAWTAFAAALAQDAPPPPSVTRGRLVVSFADYIECAIDNAFLRGEGVLLTGGGFLPSEPVAVALDQESGEIEVGTVRANPRGGLSATVVIPASASTEGTSRLRATAAKGEIGGGIVLRSVPLRIFADARDTDGDGVQDRCDTCPDLAALLVEREPRGRRRRRPRRRVRRVPERLGQRLGRRRAVRRRRPEPLRSRRGHPVAVSRAQLGDSARRVRTGYPLADSKRWRARERAVRVDRPFAAQTEISP
jgi:hypothetical protein